MARKRTRSPSPWVEDEPDESEVGDQGKPTQATNKRARKENSSYLLISRLYHSCLTTAHLVADEVGSNGFLKDVQVPQIDDDLVQEKYNKIADIKHFFHDPVLQSNAKGQKRLHRRCRVCKNQ